MPLSLPTWLHKHLLDTIRRQQPIDMSDLIADHQISERLTARTLTPRELAMALADLEQSKLVRNVRPQGAPLWGITPAGQEALERHRPAAAQSPIPETMA